MFENSLHPEAEASRNPKKTATLAHCLSSCLVAALFCVLGCSAPANRRLCQDAVVVLVAPVQIPAGGIIDTYEVHRHNPRTLLGSPIVLVHHTLKHTVITLIHAADLVAYPVALCTGSGPINLYETDSFPFRVSPETGCRVMGRSYAFVGGTAAGAGLTALTVVWGQAIIDHPYAWYAWRGRPELTIVGLLLAGGGGLYLLAQGLYAPFNPRLDKYLNDTFLEVPDKEQKNQDKLPSASRMPGKPPGISHQERADFLLTNPSRAAILWSEWQL